MILKRMEADADQEGEPLSLPWFLKPYIKFHYFVWKTNS